MIADSKDTIRSRMIRTASGLWGFTDAQDVNSFDPVVGMILGALAEELYAVYTEIKKPIPGYLENYRISFSTSMDTTICRHMELPGPSLCSRGLPSARLLNFAIPEKLPGV